MAGFNRVGNIADDLAKYVRLCGKRSVLETKPLGAINPNDLSFEPKLIDRLPISMQKYPFINRLGACRCIDKITESLAFQVKEKDGAIELLDELGNRLSTAFLIRDSDTSIQILDIASEIKGKGYGTKLLNEIKKKYSDKELQVAACWEKLISEKPPHKFYLDNGFVAKDKTMQEKLEAWVAKGAKSTDFPMECDCIEMIYKPSA